MNQETAKKISKEFDDLMKLYNLEWKFKLVPINWFSILMRKFIKFDIVWGFEQKDAKN